MKVGDSTVANGIRSMAMVPDGSMPLRDAMFEMTWCIVPLSPVVGMFANPEWVSCPRDCSGGYTASGYADPMGCTSLLEKEGTVSNSIPLVEEKHTKHTSEKGLAVADGASSIAVKRGDLLPTTLSTFYIGSSMASLVKCTGELANTERDHPGKHTE